MSPRVFAVSALYRSIRHGLIESRRNAAAHLCPLRLAPLHLLDHGGIVALAFAARHARLEHRSIERGKRHLLPAARRLLEDQPEVLQRLMDETLWGIFAAHHFCA